MAGGGSFTYPPRLPNHGRGQARNRKHEGVHCARLNTSGHYAELNLNSVNGFIYSILVLIDLLLIKMLIIRIPSRIWKRYQTSSPDIISKIFFLKLAEKSAEILN